MVYGFAIDCFLGLPKTYYLSAYCDISRREYALMVPLGLYSLILGFYPDVILTSIRCSVANILYQSIV